MTLECRRIPLWKVHSKAKIQGPINMHISLMFYQYEHGTRIKRVVACFVHVFWLYLFWLHGIDQTFNNREWSQQRGQWERRCPGWRRGKREEIKDLVGCLDIWCVERHTHTDTHALVPPCHIIKTKPSLSVYKVQPRPQWQRPDLWLSDPVPLRTALLPSAVQYCSQTHKHTPNAAASHLTYFRQATLGT